MKILISACILIAITACSTQSILTQITGIDRVNIDQDDYEKPQFFIGEFKNQRVGREPASAVKSNAKNGLSNRQLYFLSFYKQYKTMAKIINKEETLKACPSFHNIILDHKGLKEVRIKNYSTDIDFSKAKNDKLKLSYFPILAMPYSSSIDLYSVLESNNWKDSSKHIKTALNHYFKTSEKEIKELCNTGVSPGYYIYENLVTYFKQQKSFHGTKAGLKALLKVPVLANMIILDNLNQNKYHFKESQVYDQWLLNRTNAQWFGKFIHELKVKRDSRISSNFIR